MVHCHYLMVGGYNGHWSISCVCATPVQAHIHSVPALQGGERGSGRFRNSDKVAQLEDGRVDVQTQGFGRTLTWLHDPGNSRAIARAILA